MYTYLNPNNWLAGIYKITCSDTGHYYYGSSKNLKNRWKTHISRFKTHENTFIRNVHNKHPNNWMFESIVQVEPIDILLKQVEQRYLDKHWNDLLCMNINKNSSIPPNQTGKIWGPHTQDTKTKIHNATKGICKPRTKAHQEKLNTLLKGHIVTNETRQKIGNGNKGKIVELKTRIQISNKLKGRTGTMLGKHHSPETINKIKTANTGKQRPKMKHPWSLARRIAQINRDFFRNNSIIDYEI